ncbi:hypothetical protein ISS08_02405 [Candidatus Pacearchaeota archaeon]|nr:hypothetical protein [Candidatus Pacearchaeota archaeon]
MTPNQTEPTEDQKARQLALSTIQYPMIAGLASTKLVGQKYTDSNVQELVQKHVYTPSFSKDGDPAGLIYGWLEQGFDAEGQPAINREYLMNKSLKIINEAFGEITTEDYLTLLGVNPEEVVLREDIVGKYIKELSESNPELAKELKLAYQDNLVDSSVMKAIGTNRQVQNLGILEKLVQPTDQNGLAGRAQA